MFDKFKENLQKKMIEYQKQINNASNQNKNITPQKNNTLSVFIWSLTFALLINYFFFNQKQENNHQTNNQQVMKYIKHDNIKFTEKDGFLVGNINKNGITIDNILLEKYNKDHSNNSEKIEILSPAFSSDGKLKNLYSFIKLGFKNAGTNKFYIELPDDNTKWKLKSIDDNSYTLYWKNNNGFIFNRIFQFKNGYMFKVTDEIVNNSKYDSELIPYKIIQQSINIRNIDNSSLAGAIVITDSKTEEIKYKTIESKNIIRISSDEKSAIGLTDNYFANILISNDPVDVSIIYNKNLSKEIKENDKTLDIKNFQIEITDRKPITIKSNSKISYTFDVFSGAKQIEMIDNYSKQLSMPRFRMLLDYGSFFFISRPATMLLKFLNKYFNSMSIAIILFAIIMKIILLPLAIKQMKMTYKMQKMAPELKRIQTYYADNKLQQQMQIAMLYKKHKINPFSMFTQILIQIPIFLAMWRALVITIEMRHSTFLWINDLATRDPIFILPLILGLTMIIQMKLQNKTNQDDTNPGAKAIKYMPYIMTVMFAFLPSGLILYYIIGNILGIIQQEIGKYYWNKNKCN